MEFINGIKKTRKLRKANVPVMVGNKPKSLTEDLSEFLNVFQTGELEDAYYSAKDLTTFLVTLHLLKKYENDCLIPGPNFMLKYSGGKQMWDLDFFNREIVDKFKDCITKETKLIAIPFGFIVPEINEDHQNILIYRTELKQLERFEPHGAKHINMTKEQNNKLDSYIKFMFQMRFLRGVDFTYVSPEHIYTEEERGFQLIEAEQKHEYMEQTGFKGYVGFCSMWSMFYLELVLKYPTISGKILAKEVTNILTASPNTESFFRHIVGYLKFIQKEVKKLIGREDFSFEELETEGSELNKEVKEWYKKQINSLIKFA
jgi:hypothetical protein